MYTPTTIYSVCTVSTPMSFCCEIPHRVNLLYWRKASRTSDVKDLMIFEELQTPFESHGLSRSSENHLCQRYTCALDTLLQVCVSSSSFLVSTWVFFNSTHYFMCIPCSALARKLITTSQFEFDQLPSYVYKLFIFPANVFKFKHADAISLTKM